MTKEENPKIRSEALPWETAFAKSLARRRLDLEMSQTELARRATEAGLPLFQQQIQRIENLARPIRLNEAILLAQILEGDPWRMAARMVDDDTARSILLAAQEGAEQAAFQAINRISEEEGRLGQAVREASERLQQYAEYMQERHPDDFQGKLKPYVDHQVRLEWTQLLLFNLTQFLWDEDGEARLLPRPVELSEG